MPLDYNADIGILWRSIKFNKTTLKDMKISEWFLGNHVFIKYTSSEDFLLSVIFKTEHKANNIRALQYLISKDKTFFKQRLPKAVVFNEWQVELSGIIKTDFECEFLGIDADSYITGDRGK